MKNKAILTRAPILAIVQRMMKAGWEEKGKSVIERVFRRELDLNPSDFIIEKTGEFDEYLSIFTRDGRFLGFVSRDGIEAYVTATTKTRRTAAVDRIIKELEEAM